MPITYATSHIDGGLDCSRLSIGILKSTPDTPIAKAVVIAGLQAHTIWALDRLAIVIYCYAQSAKKHYQYHLNPVQVNISGALVSDRDNCIVVARSITWHTSEAIRTDAERLIAELTAGARLTTLWPATNEMVLPVNGDTADTVRSYPRSRGAED
ncbi:MAG: hypothetical protein HYR70_04200 [Chloroflexi bacterium]|nr:hypothetical protein [Chloroflexota bacterium]MBI3340758.1 hypothetical protein [Chloroflexota bacterium]